MKSFDDLDKGARIAIYGAGELGFRLLERLQAERPDIEICCLADSFQRGERGGIEVVGPETLAQRLRGGLVLIASGAIASISLLLDDLGVGNWRALDATLKAQVLQHDHVRFHHVASGLPARVGLLMGVACDIEAFERLALQDSLRFEAGGVVVVSDDAARLDIDPEGEVLVLGSALWERLADQLLALGVPVHVLDDARLGSQRKRLEREIGAQLDIWKGGYREGDPLSPVSSSKYSQLGWLSSLYVIYLTAIRPHVGPGVRVLEIGCGGGAWSRALMSRAPAELWCVDVLTPEETGFWDYVGRDDRLRHVRVEDFSCGSLPDDYFDYFFSFGCFCHLSFEAIEEYVRNLAPKLRSGAKGFLMVADYEKYNRAMSEHHDSLTRLVPPALEGSARELCFRTDQHFRDFNEDATPRPGRWFHAGVDRTCALLERCGCRIVERDMEVNVRDPLIYFQKR